jgi:hypothetical protein
LDPFGTYTAEALNEGSDAATTHSMTAIATGGAVSGATVCVGLFVKPINRTWIYIVSRVGAGGTLREVNFGLTGAGTLGAVGNVSNYGISYLNNRWYFVWSVSTNEVSGDLRTFLYIGESDGDITFSGTGNDALYICNPILETGVTTPSRFNLYDGKIHKVHASWENNYATIGIDNNWTKNPSTTIVSSTDIPKFEACKTALARSRCCHDSFGPLRNAIRLCPKDAKCPMSSDMAEKLSTPTLGRPTPGSIRLIKTTGLWAFSKDFKSSMLILGETRMMPST